VTKRIAGSEHSEVRPTHLNHRCGRFNIIWIITPSPVQGEILFCISTSAQVKAQTPSHSDCGRQLTDHLAVIMERRKKIIQILSKVLAGEITPERGLESWPGEDKADDKLLRNAWHTLYHYQIDDDIRTKDKSYALRQRQALEEIVTALQQSLIK
jgi:hypothetical protein